MIFIELYLFTKYSRRNQSFWSSNKSRKNCLSLKVKQTHVICWKYFSENLPTIEHQSVRIFILIETFFDFFSSLVFVSFRCRKVVYWVHYHYYWTANKVFLLFYNKNSTWIVQICTACPLTFLLTKHIIICNNVFLKNISCPLYSVIARRNTFGCKLNG